MRALLNLLRSKSGAAAVEYAMIAPIFFAIMFSVLETGVLLINTSTLDDSVAQSARLVYTGQAPTKEALETAVCDTLPLAPNCENDINVELIVIDEFGSEPDEAVACRDSEDEDFEPVNRYSSVVGSQIVLMRVCLTTNIFTPGIGTGLSLPKTDTGRFQLVASTAFMSEPF